MNTLDDAAQEAMGGGAAPEPEALVTPEEARALMRAASGRAPTGIRNRALIAVMYRSGLRPGEALALTGADVDLAAGRIAVPARKAGRGRRVGMDRATRAVLERWIARRAERGLGDDRPLFCTLAGEPLKAAYVRELLPRLASRAGVDKRVHPLGLRYANAAELAAEGYPAALIDRHLGVAATGSARRYQRQFGEEEAAEAIAAREWLP
jgi:site-specific recombinase XerD